MKQVLIKLAYALWTLSIILSPMVGNAQGFAEEAINRARVTAGEANLETRQSITNIIADLIQVVLGLVGILFFLLTLWGGYLWMTAQGNDQKVADAKKIIVRAVIGMVVVLTAYSITYFIALSVEGTIR